MSIDPNAPAYPNTTARDTGSKIVHDVTGGLTIRAEIASRIMAGMMANPGLKESPLSGQKLRTKIAEASVEMADALLTTLNEPKA